MKRLIVLALLLSGCVRSPDTVRQESSLLAGLTPQSKADQGADYTAKATSWRSASDLPAAWFRVESLGERFGNSRRFYTRFADANTIRGRARNASLPGTYYSYNVDKEASSRNKLGNVKYLHLRNPERQCVFMLQYWGSSARFEDAAQLLGSNRAEGWYCDKALSDSDIVNFVKGVTY